MKLDLIDVFGAQALRGNPLAVVHGAEGMSVEAMQALTRWLGFSETTFLLPPTDPDADYRVRIFYPAGELPFAGHPTLGTCHAWLAAGGVPKNAGRIVQECGVGLVKVRRDGDRLAFRAPPLINGALLTDAERAETAALANVPVEAIIDARHAYNGPEWRMLRLRSAEEVLAVQPQPRAPAGTDIALVAPAASGSGADWEIRAFFTDPAGKLVEDPVTGSLNAAVAQHLFADGLATGSYIAAQGRCTGADGRVHCSIDDQGQVWIAGRTDTIAAGATLAA
ncbi:PhzF family phenazine biosynthesis protein [Sphingomonas koreensis]